ncbi:16S rRNA (guanine(966)-N(2))-methyltransferase RsmD [Pseudidiomarina sediminum]|uniref:Ribosomal RNA small subunit methyltransferase D n=1 Tax=Pseudidiomarina sediminum TaxID=431675 RepID=A0A432ZA73_9GAMM|nr:16S rRNA (guanine(966)-N(2))-methyltransferase RsmD [Pseudidiomarina sediminum]MBY6064059.1 16S rRNA (guanine(966)-N(2))-methyltransferase RsmD [Pseudidiomarina sediminum]RUO74854.1 16S rRNA (guanine(966)-N(2))-methyltransferase RsmD [Pseudidiomarina sediminum]
MRRRANKQKSSPAQGSGQLRIIGGTLRGRKLAIADLPGLRPTTDRVRETLFNWLQFEIAEQRCLDVFAGTGALGLEALSRGASAVTLLEQQHAAVAMLKRHLGVLNAQCHGHSEVIATDALKWLAQPAASAYDIVFIDPPFRSNLAAPCCQLLQQNGYVHGGSWIYLETEKEWPLDVPEQWQLQREKVTGQLCSRLFRVAAEEDS